MSVIDGTSNTVSGRVSFGVRIGQIAINSQSNRIYVTTFRSSVNVITGQMNGTVSVVDGATNSIVADVPIAPFPSPLAINAATNRIYVGGRPPNSFSPIVEVIDGLSNSVIATALDPNNPVGVVGFAINKTTNTVYAATSAEILVLNGASNSFINNITFAIVHLSNTTALAGNEATNETFFAVSPSTVSLLAGFNFFNRQQ
jgi:DNA-binding beta-propeller fold protein YncE